MKWSQWPTLAPVGSRWRNDRTRQVSTVMRHSSRRDGAPSISISGPKGSVNSLHPAFFLEHWTRLDEVAELAEAEAAKERRRAMAVRIGGQYR